MKTRPADASRLLVILITLILGFAAVPARADTPAGFQFVGGPVEERGVPGIYEWRYLDKVGDTFYDKIALHRIARGPRVEAHRAITVLYLPGTNMNGDIALTNPRY